MRVFPALILFFKMAFRIYLLSCLCLAVSAAPPSQQQLYQQHAPAQLQQINPYDYYLANQEVPNYLYSQPQQKQVNQNSDSNGAPSRLETLEPDSEVELIPGAQSPQQPPQQNPVSPNIPGLAPGQRVFIVHMPVPGYRPGTIGGYQPVYIVAAAPQGNNAYPANGYQNAILLDPTTGQAVISPLLGYPRQFGIGQGAIGQGANPNLLGPLVNRPFEYGYQEPVYAYQPGSGPQVPQAPEGVRSSVRLNQYVGLQGTNLGNNPRSENNEAEAAALSEQKKQATDSNETKERIEERRRPTTAQQIRNKV
ncbi:uncharacterized protein LOC128670820 [Plodia interpunctella]|uniref:uncharacterized protein LOC128670820 n=1 Tax=Plodia interpunctella TaxID=58824 RepID=UPI0023688F08|nr:uncharacterized protein LOC128670820 [Plodia interpunctella]